MRMTPKKTEAQKQAKKRTDLDAEISKRATEGDMKTDAAKLKELESDLLEKAQAIDAERVKLKPLEEEVAKMRAVIRQQHDDAVAANIEGLLAVTPEHSRPTCSDGMEEPDVWRCTRCALLYLKENTWDVSSFNVEVATSSRIK